MIAPVSIRQPEPLQRAGEFPDQAVQCVLARRPLIAAENQSAFVGVEMKSHHFLSVQRPDHHHQPTQL